MVAEMAAISLDRGSRDIMIGNPKLEFGRSVRQGPTRNKIEYLLCASCITLCPTPYTPHPFSVLSPRAVELSVWAEDPPAPWLAGRSSPLRMARRQRSLRRPVQSIGVHAQPQIRDHGSRARPFSLPIEV